MLKKFLKMLLSSALICSLAAPGASVLAETVTAEGSGTGAHGEVKVEVSFEGNRITGIDILEEQENETLAEPVFTGLKEEIIARNSIDVDVVTGSTQSSEALITAVEEAIKAAGITLVAVSTEDEAEGDALDELAAQEYDVVVVGSGGAGFSAAIEAATAGKSVILLEKLPIVGGNTLISGGEMNAPGNWVQETLGIEDSVELYYEDTVKSGEDKGVPELVQLMAESALESAEWLRDEINVEFYDDQLFYFGGHSVERALIPLGHTGQEIITKFQAKADELGIDVITEAGAEELLQDESDRIIGVKANTKDGFQDFLAKDGVILTTGGFGANEELRVKYNQEYDDRYLETVSPGSQGDGIVMAEAVGADLMNMQYIQTYPVADPETGRISLLADTRFDGAILINQEGERFVEELERRDVISQAILAQTGGYAYQLWNDALDQVSNSKELHQAEYESLLERGLLVEADSIEEVAEAFDIPVDNLKATLEKVAEYAETGEDKDFNHRKGLVNMDEGRYYLMKCKPSIHHTMGGLVINEKAEVLNTDGEPIEGLYAAGELTGVIHGVNRLGGNAITDIITFGRIAGQTVGNN